MVFALQQLAAHAGVDGAHPPSKEQALGDEANGVGIDDAVTCCRQCSEGHAALDAHCVTNARPLWSNVVVHCSHVAPEQHARAEQPRHAYNHRTFLCYISCLNNLFIKLCIYMYMLTSICIFETAENAGCPVFVCWR